MKYICTTIINLSVEQTVRLWTDEDHFDEWQDGFESIELLEGEKDAVGSKSKIIFKQGKRKLELTETIISNNLPKEKKALYEHIHMSNTQTTRFERISDSRTRFTSEVEYTNFKGFMPKLMAKLFSGMFQKQSQKWMDQFKEFAEGVEWS